MVNIQPGEGRHVAIMTVYSVAAVGGVLTIGFNGVAQTLFLSRLPAADVPFTFILPATAIVLTLLLYNRLTARIWLPHLAAGSSALLLVLACAFRFLLATEYGHSFPVLAAIFLYSETAASVVIMQFWTFAGQIFDPRQARRLFGLIAAGGTVSTVVAGVSLVALVRLMGVDNMILIIAASLGVCGACAVALRRDVPRSTGPRPAAQPAGGSPERPALLQDLIAIWRSPLLRAIAGLTVLVSLLINIGAYQFFLALQLTYAGRGEALAAFLGGFAIWTGILALGMQLFGTSPVMTRFGFFAAQLFFPLAMVVSGGAVLLTWGALWAVTITRACDPIFRRTIHEASLNALYLPAPVGLRQRAKALLEGLYALTFGLAGAIFLLVQHTAPPWTYQYWSAPVVFLAICWVALLLWARHQYALALAQSVNQRRLDFQEFTLDIADETTMAVLVEALHSADERRVVHVLDLIADARGAQWLPHVTAMLTHPSPQVRVMALRYLGRIGEVTPASEIGALLQAPEDDVRSAAIEALWTAVGPEAAQQILPFLDDPGQQTVGSAVTSLLRLGDREYALRAAGRLEAMLASDAPGVRREAARVLGALAGDILAPAVLSLLDSANPAPSGSVRDKRAATPRILVAWLIRLLGDKRTRAAAVDGLVRHGCEAVPALGAVLGDRTHDRTVRVEVTKILQRIGGRSAAQALLDHMAEPDEVVRGAVYHALAQLRTSGTDVPVDQTALDARIIAEIADCYRLRVWHDDIDTGDGGRLLGDALFDRMDGTVDRTFSLLALRYPEYALLRARQSLRSTDSSARAMAIELLESLVERSVGELLIPFLEAPAQKVVEIAGARLGIPRRSAVECLAELAESADPWLSACAIYQIGILHDSRHAALVMAALTSDDALVCEAALSACRRLLDRARFDAILTEQATTAGSHVVRLYAQALLRDMDAA
jgi:HEAT repeat protein